MNEVYAGLEPQEVWRHFGELNRIPRPSGQEQKARDYVRQVAASAGASCDEDARGNLVVRVAASAGRESAPTVAIQSHLDMVCQKRPDVEFDFARDAIVPRRNGNLITATGTTLGADNGIGAAMMLAILTSPDVEHGPLELLFTIEEETGLHGAMDLDASLLSAKLLLNLDSEDPDDLTAGCAGGAGTTLHLPVEWQSVAPNYVGREIVVAGLRGGHSGVQIHEPLANAIKILSHVLDEAQYGEARQQALPQVQEFGMPHFDENAPPEVELHFALIEGGSAHNAIPRDASASVAVLPEDAARLEEAAAKEQPFWIMEEPNLRIEIREIEPPNRVMSRQNAFNLTFLLGQLPHGVQEMSRAFPGKVATSANLAEVHTHDDEVAIHVSVRSFYVEEISRIQHMIRASAGNAKIEVAQGYPGWEPNPHSPLLQTAREVYPSIYSREPKVEVVHAGLECGVIASKISGLDAISFGPLIRGPHSPDESVEVESVATTWRFLAALLAKLAA